MRCAKTVIKLAASALVLLVLTSSCYGQVFQDCSSSEDPDCLANNATSISTTQVPEIELDTKQENTESLFRTTESDFYEDDESVIFPDSSQEVEETGSSPGFQETGSSPGFQDDSTGGFEGQEDSDPGFGGCKLNGLEYEAGDEFFNGCKEYCICQADSSLACFEIDCPSEFGLDVLVPDCIEWDKHENFVASPPTCCPPVPTCISRGQCEYKNESFPNFENIPMSLTGCEQRCYCEDSTVQCQDACNPLSSTPPKWLPCEASRAIKVPEKERPCCEMWDCRDSMDCTILPQKLEPSILNPVNATHISIRFHLPPEMEGYAGYLQIQYSAGFSGSQDHSAWPRFKFDVSGGKFVAGPVDKVFGPVPADTQYFIRPAAFVKECEDRLILDDIKPVRTPAEVIEPEIETVYLNMELNASQVTHSAAMIEWRHFAVEEKVFVDGVQLQYWVLRNGNLVSQVPQTSPILHRDTTYHQLNNLKPDTQYEVNLDVVQVQGAVREMYSDRKLMFRTQPYVDEFEFDLKVELVGVDDYSAVIRWVGPPAPEQKYVSIFRIIYYAEIPNSIQDEISLFKISDSFSSPQINITSLNPNTTYKLWIEAYLRNGKKLKSNVAEFRTPHLYLTDTNDLSELTAQPSTAEEGKTVEEEDSSYYYRVMVALAVVFTFAIVAFLILLYFYMHQNITYTVTMNKPPKETKNKNGTTGGGGNESSNEYMFNNSGYKGDNTGGSTVEMNSIHTGFNGNT